MNKYPETELRKKNQERIDNEEDFDCYERDLHSDGQFERSSVERSTYHRHFDRRENGGGRWQIESIESEKKPQYFRFNSAA